MLKTRLVAIFAALVTSAVAFGAPPEGVGPVGKDSKVAAKLEAAEQWMTTMLSHEVVPGAAAAIVHDQEIVWSKGFGFANLESRVEATPETLFSICSVSKLFTSVAAMQLRDRGKLDIDAPISEYLPWFQIQGTERAEEPVTIRSILSHASGLPREAATPYWTEVEFPEPETVRKLIGEQSMLYVPYEYFQYSNLGMTLAGEAVAAASGETYHAYVKRHILDPLELYNTYSELPASEYGKQMAIGYLLRNASGMRKPLDYYAVSGIAPAAGFASSVEDLAAFASWQFRLLETGGEEVLKATTLREMQRVHWMSPDWDGSAWGLGFSLSRRDDKTFVGHGGYCPGFRTSFITRPQDKLAVVVMMNVNDVSPSEFAFDLYDLTAKDIVAAAKSDDETPSKKLATSADLTVYEGVYRHGAFPSATYVVPYGDELLGISLYSEDPADGLLRLKHVEEHTFRRVRDDDSEAEPVWFELDESGRPYRLWRHGNYLTRIE